MKIILLLVIVFLCLHEICIAVSLTPKQESAKKLFGDYHRAKSAMLNALFRAKLLEVTKSEINSSQRKVKNYKEVLQLLKDSDDKFINPETTVRRRCFEFFLLAPVFIHSDHFDLQEKCREFGWHPSYKPLPRR